MCNNFIINNQNVTELVNLIDLSERKNILSLVIDDNKLENNDFVNIIIEPETNNTNNRTLCFELFVGSENDFRELSFFSLKGGKINEKLENFTIKYYPGY